MFREFAVETQGFDVVVMNAITGLRCIYIKLNVSENSLRNTLKGVFFLCRKRLKIFTNPTKNYCERKGRYIIMERRNVRK